MVTIDPADEAPKGLTGKEYVEWMNRNKKPIPTETVADEEVEPIAKPAIKGKQVGQMRAAKGGKPAGEVEEFKSHKGYYVPSHTFRGKHPTLAKAIDIGKKAIGKAGEFVDEEILHHGEEEQKKPTGEEQKEEEKKVKEKKKKTQKKLTGIEKGLKKGLLGDEDEEDDDEKIIKTKKSQILSRNYESAYGGDGGLSGTRGYKSAYSGSRLGSGVYQSAYKTTAQTPTLTQPATRGRIKEEPVIEESVPREQIPIQRKPMSDRFNIQNWQSIGFPNTLPQSARGNLFRPAPPRPQPTVIPMVRQPYQPRPTPQPMPPMRAPARAPMSGPMPRIGLNLNTMPQLMKPRATITTPRAPGTPSNTKVPNTTSLTFMGVNLNEKKKPEQKPITKMGEGYKHVPLVVMNGIYPNAGYDPKKDSITKKSIIPKISATITPNNFTMFGYKMKNRKL